MYLFSLLWGTPALVCLPFVLLAAKNLLLIEAVGPCTLTSFSLVMLIVNSTNFIGEVTDSMRQQQIYQLLCIYAFELFFLSASWLQGVVMRVAIFLVSVTAMMVHR